MWTTRGLQRRDLPRIKDEKARICTDKGHLSIFGGVGEICISLNCSSVEDAYVIWTLSCWCSDRGHWAYLRRNSHAYSIALDRGGWAGRGGYGCSGRCAEHADEGPELV